MMMREMKSRGMILLVFLLAAYILASCGLLAGTKDDLAGTKWKIETIGGAQPAVNLVITAEFNDGRVSGTSGCNSYGAAYSAKDGKLELTDTAVTEMACEDSYLMESEQTFLTLLGSVRAYQLSDSRLELKDEAGNVVLTFVKGE